MKKFVTFSAAALAATFVSADLTAQRDLVSGFGTMSQLVDLDAATGVFGQLGIQHLNGEIYVTSRINPSVGGEHFVTVYDNSGSGVFTRSWVQQGFAQASEWGFRDGATDGSNLMFGFDFGIQIHDEDGNILIGFGDPNLQSANGPHFLLGGLINGNVLEPDQAGITRAIAYDRTGNGGDGSFWAGNFGSSTFEINVSGDIITTNANAGEVSYGFAFDPLFPGTHMWINSAPNSSTIAKYDVTTGTLTGQVLDQGQHGTNAQGGLDIVPGTLGRGPNASGSDFLQLQQGQPDEFRIQRLHLDQAGQGVPASPLDRDGAIEPNLLTTVDNEAIFDKSDRASLNYTIDSFELDMFFDISPNPGDGMGSGGANGLTGVIFLNVGLSASPGLNATSNVLGIRELSHLQPLLTIPTPARAPKSRGVIGTNDPMNPGPGEWRPALTPGSPFAAIGDCIRAQILFVDAAVNFLPIAFTNQARLCRGADPIRLEGTFAEFNGNNTFNADETSGYFSLTNDETDTALSIVAASWSIKFDRPGNSPTTVALFENRFRWDTDNPNMADVFEGGNSLLIDCTGTYRNGSELSTGLIFAGTPAQNGAPCDDDPLILQGWIGTDSGPDILGSADGDWLTVNFTFDPDTFMNGVKFEFDVDTDGGVGVNGNSMAGVIVTVEFRNGTTSTSEVLADVNNPARAFAQL